AKMAMNAALATQPDGMGRRSRSSAGTPAAPLAMHPNATGPCPAVWFHDDTVVPGKTYQYRMRVNLWNRYLGQLKSLANPEDASKAVLAGDWSEPTDPITAAPAIRFFVKCRKPDSAAALIEVWKWRRGDWLRQSFEAAVGDVIGAERKIDGDAGD